jgi:hypothetical protein
MQFLILKLDQQKKEDHLLFTLIKINNFEYLSSNYNRFLLLILFS